MAKCPGCGSELAPAARFCPLCGRAVTSPPPSAAPGTGSVQARGLSEPPREDAGRRKVLYASIAGALLVLLGVFLVVRARSGVLSASQPVTPSAGVLSAPPTPVTSAPVLAAPPQQAPQAPVVAAPQSVQNPMPEDIIAYLRWLKRFEAGRRDLEYKGMAEMTVFTQKVTTGALESLLKADPTGDDPPPPKPEDNPIVGIGKVIQDWNRAAMQFQQVQPPNPCAPLAGHYNQALTAGVARMSALQGTLTSALQSIQGAGGQSTSVSKDALADLYKEKSGRAGSVDVDTAYANANEALNQLRAQYTSMPEDVRTFDIKSGGGDLKLPFMGM